MSTNDSVKGYRGPQVCKIVGITYRQLDHWDRTGLISPSLATARGSGTQRLYSYQDVVVLKIIKQLLDSGLSLQGARKAIDYFREQVSGDLASASLVLGPTGTVVARSDGELLDLMKGGQGVFNVVPLAGVMDDVEAGIHEFAGEAASPEAKTDRGAGDQPGKAARAR